MTIRVNLDLMLVRRGMTLSELAERMGITLANVSILKTNKARAVRFTTLDAICRELGCQPGDLLEYVPDEPADRQEDAEAEPRPPRRNPPGDRRPPETGKDRKRRTA